MMQGHHRKPLRDRLLPGAARRTRVRPRGRQELGLLLTQIVEACAAATSSAASPVRPDPAAKEAGADHVVVDTDPFAEEALRLTDGDGVHVVL